MEYEKIDLGSYHIHFINTDKFKTTTISVNFREKILKENITIRKFLFQMLCSTTLKYNTNRLFEIKLEDLYSASLGFSNIKFGNVINSYIDIKFLNKKYSDNKLLDEALDFLFEIIFNPNVKKGKFDSRSFELVKERLLLVMNSEKENIQKYTLNRSLELMDSNDPASFNLWGYKDDLNKITEENLFDYYKSVLNTNIIDVFVVDNIDKKKILEKFKKCFIVGNNKRDNIEAFITYDKLSKLKEKDEEMELKQSKLSIICKILNLSLYERRYVLPIYSNILGGGGVSRLFTNVREKNSLCYTITSMSNTPNSILMIYSGIDSINKDKALKLIKKELKLKNVTKEELKNSKKELIASVETLLDNPGSIINYYFGMEVFNADDIKTKIKNYKKVSIEDIESLSNKIEIAMVYFLKGIENEKNKN